MMRSLVLAVFAALAISPTLRAQERPTPEMLTVLDPAPEPGPRITPLLRHQLDRAWAQDEARRARFAAIHTEADLVSVQKELRATVLGIIGGLPAERTPLNATVTGTLARDGYRIEKVIFESQPGFQVTSSLYVPDGPAGRKPAVLLACGHAPTGKAYPAYQEIAGRLAKRGYVVLVWDPVGQGERSQYWDSAKGRSRYNLVCGEHAVLGNLATIAGASLLRWMVWDGMRAVDYLLARPEVDPAHIAVTGTSGGGTQSTWLGALDERIGLLAPSCFVTSLPMRMANRIFEDPDSDPEQDPPGLVAEGVDHPGLLLLAYPRRVHIASAVKDFFPIEGTRKTARELRALYSAFGHGDRFALTEGYHGHQYSAENQASAFAFLDRWTGKPTPAGLPTVTALEPEALRCTSSGQVRVDLPGRSLQELIRDFYRERRDRSVNVAEAYAIKGQRGPKDWPVVPFDGTLVEDRIAWEARGRSTLGSVTIDRYLLHHRGPLLIPLVHIHGAQKATSRIVLRERLTGKIGPENWTEVEADLRRGDEVVSFDPRGLGETRLRYKAESIDDKELAAIDEDKAYASPISGVLANYVYNALLTGRPYLFELVEDAEIAIRFSRERLGAKTLAAAGRGDAHHLARVIAAALPGVELMPAAAGDAEFSWPATVEKMEETWPIHYVVPGGAYLRLYP
jgi:dienelactone hydrolase